GLAPLQPRVSRALRPLVLGRERDAEGLSAHVRSAARAHPQRRPDRRRVRARLPPRRLSPHRDPHLLEPPLRRPLDDDAALGGEDVLGRVRALAGPAMTASVADLAAGLHARADAAWRSPVAAATGWALADAVDERLLRHAAEGAFWETLAALDVTLL